MLIPYLREEAGALDPADRKALAPLFKKLQLQRASARRAVLRALRSERYLALLASIEAAAAGPPPGGAGLASGRGRERVQEAEEGDAHR